MPAAPQSWSDSTSPAETSSTDASISFFPVNGSPIWTDGRFSAARVVELLAREDGGAADAVATGRRAVEDDEVPRGRRLRPHEPLDREQPDAHRVHEAVVAVGLVEDRLAADGRDADAVAVVADPSDRAREVPVGLGEAQAVEERDGPRAHRHDVAQDPADSGRGALERLDGGRVVVALDLERDRETVAEIEHAGVLARALQHPRPGRGQPLQQERRVLVAAVLRPEEREDRELEVVRVAPEERADSLELPVREAKCAMERRIRRACSEDQLIDGVRPRRSRQRDHR